MIDVCAGCKLWHDGLCHNICNMAIAELREWAMDTLPTIEDGLLIASMGGRQKAFLWVKEEEYRHYANRFTYGEPPKIPGEKATYTEGQL